MIKFLNRLCGDGLSCPFEKALRNCTYSDWTIPPQQDIQYVINCLSGAEAKTIRSQKAFTIFRMKFQNSQQKNNSAFLLKNLYILDKCSQQKVMLDIIAHYQNNRLFYDKSLNPENSTEIQAIKQFVGSYYLLIKKKALIYQKFPNQVFVNKKRTAQIRAIAKAAQIFELIDNCFQIQKLINQTNQKVKKCNKTALLIQNILIGILKVYIFCYSIVSISLQALLTKIAGLKASQLNNFFKLIKYYNKQYTNSFLAFLESNKSIDAFKTFQYSELIKIDQRYVKIVENYIKLKNVENSKINFNQSYDDCISPKRQSQDPTNDDSIIKDSQFLNIRELPEKLLSSLKCQIKFSYKQRKTIEIVISVDAHQYQNAFQNYSNYYSQNMIQEEKRISQGGDANMNSSLILSKKKSKILTKKSIMQDLVNSKFKKAKLIRQKQAETSKKFNPTIWDKWENIYAY